MITIAHAAAITHFDHLFAERKRSQIQGCYNIVNCALMRTHVSFILAKLLSDKSLMDAIILAAGRGARLRPLTDTCPKPLLEVAGITLIELHIQALVNAGVSHIIINLHHLGEHIQARIGDGQRFGVKISYSIEKPAALETAGGIRKALALIKTNSFVVISADILCDFPLDLLMDDQNDRTPGYIVLVENPSHHPHGDFHLDTKTGMIGLVSDTRPKAFTFSGIARFEKSLFQNLKPGKLALRPVLEVAIQNRQLEGCLHQGLWSDIGTIDRLNEARHAPEILEYIESIKKSIN